MFKMLRGEEAKVVETWPGIKRKTLALGERTLLLEVNLRAGAISKAHSHENEQIGYVVRGKIKIRIGEEVHYLSQGDAYIIPGNVDHETEAIEDSLVVEVFSPPHELFKKDLEG